MGKSQSKPEAGGVAGSTSGAKVNEEQAKRRSNIAKEILMTEENYVENLSIMLDVFVVPLTERNLIPAAAIRAVFSITETIHNVHRELLRELRERISSWSESTLIGDVFLRTCVLMTMYSVYANNFGNSTATLETLKSNAKWTGFLEEAKANPRCRSQELNSFLILPIQRIPRYLLLLNDLVKHTPSEHPDRNALVEAASKIQVIAAGINEKKRESESMTRVFQIDAEVSGQPQTLVQPGRTFLFEGDLELCKAGKSPTRAHLYLFNDLLLAATPTVISAIWGPKYSIKVGFPLDRFAISLCPEPGFFEINSIGAPRELTPAAAAASAASSAASSAAPSTASSPVSRRRSDVASPKRDEKSAKGKEPSEPSFWRSITQSWSPSDETPKQREKRLAREKLKKEKERAEKEKEKKRLEKEKSERLEREKLERAQKKQEEEEAKSRPKSMMPDKPMRLVFQATSPDVARAWVKRIHDAQMAQHEKIEAWNKAMETKGGVVTDDHCQNSCIIS